MVHRGTPDVWGTCTFHTYSARSPNRVTTVRAYNWVLGGALLPQANQSSLFLPTAGLLYFLETRLPAPQKGPPVAFRTKCELLVDLGRQHAKACKGKHLLVFDGSFALRRVVRRLVKSDEPGQPRIEFLTRLRHDARMYALLSSLRRPGQGGPLPKYGRRLPHGEAAHPRAAGHGGPLPKYGRRLPPPRHGGRWPGPRQVRRAFMYGRERQVRYKEVLCLWRVLGHDVVFEAVAADKKQFTLVGRASELSGLQLVELFCVRFRQEDGFRDLKWRLGWEECRAWTRNPIERTTRKMFATMTGLRLLQLEL